jgi:hypothetical protein
VTQPIGPTLHRTLRSPSLPLSCRYGATP